MAQIDLKAVNSKLKSREKRTHQNVAPVPKELGELRLKTHALEAKARKLKNELAEVKRKKKISRGWLGPFSG